MTLTTKHDREFNVEEALASWWNEYKHFEYEPMSKKHFEPNIENQVGHYTQVDKSYLISNRCKFWLVEKM